MKTIFLAIIPLMVFLYGVSPNLHDGLPKEDVLSRVLKAIDDEVAKSSCWYRLYLFEDEEYEEDDFDEKSGKQMPTDSAGMILYSIEECKKALFSNEYIRICDFISGDVLSAISPIKRKIKYFIQHPPVPYYVWLRVKPPYSRLLKYGFMKEEIDFEDHPMKDMTLREIIEIYGDDDYQPCYEVKDSLTLFSGKRVALRPSAKSDTSEYRRVYVYDWELKSGSRLGHTWKTKLEFAFADKDDLDQKPIGGGQSTCDDVFID